MKAELGDRVCSGVRAAVSSAAAAERADAPDVFDD